MAYTVTFDELMSEIQSIVENDAPEFVAELPKHISQAQDRVQRDLQLSIWRNSSTGMLVSGNRSIARDPKCLKILSIELTSTGAFLTRRSYDYVMQMRQQKMPRVYCEASEGEVFVGSIPDSNYAFKMSSLKRLDPLSDTNQENWITRNAADLLLIAATANAERYLMGSERASELENLYSGLITGALNELRGLGREEYEPARTAAKPKLKAETRA